MKHGAGAPQVKAAARRRLQLDALNGNLAALLEELEVDAGSRHPIEVLLDTVSRCHAMAQVLGALVGGLSADTNAPPDGIGAGVKGVRLWGPNHLGDGAPHVLVTEYGVWLERAARASKLALDAGVDERLVRVNEQQLAIVDAAVKRTMLDVFSMVRRALGVEHREVAVALEARLGPEIPKLLAGHLRSMATESLDAAER